MRASFHKVAEVAVALAQHRKVPANDLKARVGVGLVEGKRRSTQLVKCTNPAPSMNDDVGVVDRPSDIAVTAYERRSQ